MGPHPGFILLIKSLKWTVTLIKSSLCVFIKQLRRPLLSLRSGLDYPKGSTEW